MELLNYNLRRFRHFTLIATPTYRARCAMLLDYAHCRELPLLYQFPLSEQPIKHFMYFDDWDAHQARLHYPMSKTQARHL